jgi:hypothetical protein
MMIQGPPIFIMYVSESNDVHVYRLDLCVCASQSLNWMINNATPLVACIRTPLNDSNLLIQLPDLSFTFIFRRANCVLLSLYLFDSV